MVGLKVQEKTEAGVELGVVSAVAAALADARLSSRCAACFGVLQSCRFSCEGACDGTVSYCSLRCHSSDADLHSKSGECHLLMLAQSLELTGSIEDTCDLRAALRLATMYSSKLGFGGDRIGGLLSNHSRHPQVEEAGRLMHFAQRLAGSDVVQEVDMQRAYCTVVTNGVQVEVYEANECLSPLRVLLGTGVYQPAFSWLNHSCRPTACYHFVVDSSQQHMWPKHPWVVVRSIQVIDADQEVTISYTDLLKPKLVRQYELQHKYKFACKCRRCDEIPLSYADITLGDASFHDAQFIQEEIKEAMVAFFGNDDVERCKGILEPALLHLITKENISLLHSTSLDAFSLLQSAYKVLAVTGECKHGSYLAAAAGLAVLVVGIVQHLYNVGEHGLVIVLGSMWLHAGEALLQADKFTRTRSTREQTDRVVDAVALLLSTHVIHLVTAADVCHTYSDCADCCLQHSKHLLKLCYGSTHPLTENTYRMAMATALSSMASCVTVTKQRISIRCESENNQRLRGVGRNTQRRALLLSLAHAPFVAVAAQAQDMYTLATSGLEYCDTLLGSGAPIPKGTLIKAHYTGKLEDGTVFDTSYKRGKPLTFKLGVGEVIKGWDQGILGGDDVPPMLPGGKRKLRIPPSLGYGERGAGCRGGKCVIPPNSVLLFDVELIGKA